MTPSWCCWRDSAGKLLLLLLLSCVLWMQQENPKWCWLPSPDSSSFTRLMRVLGSRKVVRGEIDMSGTLEFLLRWMGWLGARASWCWDHWRYSRFTRWLQESGKLEDCGLVVEMNGKDWDHQLIKEWTGRSWENVLVVRRLRNCSSWAESLGYSQETWGSWEAKMTYKRL